MNEKTQSEAPLRAILVDDEPASLESLQIMLRNHCPQVQVVVACPGPADGLRAIEAHRPDLVFLDIEMPGMNGFEMLERIEGIDFDIVFITAYDEFAIKAFRVSAMDYLLKPVEEDQLVEAVRKVEEKRREHAGARAELLLTNLRGEGAGFTKLALPSHEGLDFVNIEDILHCQADGNYTTIHTVGGERYLISRTLKEFEELLGQEQFFRTHQSHLVNLSKIKKYIRGSGGEIVLVDGTRIQVARARKELLMSRIYPH